MLAQAPQWMVQPSLLLASGICTTPFGSTVLFRFTPELQARSDELLGRSRESLLDAVETAELAAIEELARIFTFINAQLSATAQWCPIERDDRFNNGPTLSVNIATRPSI